MSNQIKILFVDDEQDILMAYQRVFRDSALYEIHTQQFPLELDYEHALTMDVIVCDQRMPHMLGTDIFHKLASLGFQGKKIICSGFSDFDDITQAFNEQAIDHFLNKPWDNEELRSLVTTYKGQSKVSSTESATSDNLMAKAYGQASKAAQSDVPIYINGETGTGKEVMTQFVHQQSTRSQGPLISVNCATLTADLFESLMFGHKKGAFTGAVKDHEGFFEAANGGTLFLDEVVDIPPTAQAKILRALQEQTITRLGDTQDRKVDVRIISASAKPLKTAVKEGRFREDLMYRLNVFPINIPPLRERLDEIPTLIQHFLMEYNFHRDWEDINCPDSVINHLLNYPWPGNIRELKNLCNYLCASIEAPTIELTDLPEEYQYYSNKTQISEDRATTGSSSPDQGTKLTVEEALRQCNNNKTQAAKLLGISRMTLWRKLNNETHDE